MTRLNQVIGLVAGAKQSANRDTAPLFQAAKNPNLFVGLAKTYEPAQENGAKLPDESVRVQWTVEQLLKDFVKSSSRLLDLTSTMENANTTARADVRIGGEVIVADAPVTFLLPFEKFLRQEVRGLVLSLPTLDPAQSWETNEVERSGIMQGQEVKRARLMKIEEPLVLAPATDRHPAQVQLIGKDVLAGYWTERRFSGAVSASRKQELLERVEALIDAVVIAREEANSAEVIDKPVSAKIFGYLFS